MCPSRLAVHHPTYETLLEYATGGYPDNTVRNRTKEEIHAAVMRVPHEYALPDKAIVHFDAESKGKLETKRAHLVLCDELKGDLPEQIRVLPISAIPHKSRAF